MSAKTKKPMPSGKYDGSKCPLCRSEDVNGESIEPVSADIAFRPCSCNDCGASWTEELKVVGYNNLYPENASESLPETQ